jgi:hypothetical protein
MPKPKEPNTHFEQVPLKVVKKVATEYIPENDADRTDVTSEPPAKK